MGTRELERGVALLLAGSVEDGLIWFRRAAERAMDPLERELADIHAAEALIAVGRHGEEVAALPEIILRRHDASHVFRAASALHHRYRIAEEFGKADRYASVALRVATEEGDDCGVRETLIAWGQSLAAQSRVDEAATRLEHALRIGDQELAEDVRTGHAIETLGYCRVMQGRVHEGISLLHRACNILVEPSELAEIYLDLCLAYLKAGDMGEADTYGRHGLACAVHERQVRNAHYLLGTVARERGDLSVAAEHFMELASFYPAARHLLDVLMSVDLTEVVNLKR